MRTRTSTVTFSRPFVLNRDVGELPAGSYSVEIDEAEFGTLDRVGHRQVAVYLYVQQGATTRTIAASPRDLDAALGRDQRHAGGTSDA